MITDVNSSRDKRYKMKEVGTMS